MFFILQFNFKPSHHWIGTLLKSIDEGKSKTRLNF